MPDADQMMTFVAQVIAQPLIVVGALVGALLSMLAIYVAILDMFDITPRRGPR